MSVNNTLFSTAADSSGHRAQVGIGPMCIRQVYADFKAAYHLTCQRARDVMTNIYLYAPSHYLSLRFSLEGITLPTQWLYPHCREEGAGVLLIL